MVEPKHKAQFMSYVPSILIIEEALQSNKLLPDGLRVLQQWTAPETSDYILIAEFAIAPNPESVFAYIITIGNTVTLIQGFQWDSPYNKRERFPFRAKSGSRLTIMGHQTISLRYWKIEEHL